MKMNDTNISFDLRKINQVSFKMIACPKGEFWMGTDDTNVTTYWDWAQPRHLVKMNHRFWIGETLVTQSLWETVMGFNPSHFQESSQLPVENITWYDCLDFCNRLSELDHLEPCFVLSEIKKRDIHIISASVEWLQNANGYRLPTEAEWEYCAKASTELIYSGSNQLDEIAWYDANSDHKTHDVKTKKSNTWGLYDMTGNVYEWCMDQYDSHAYKNRLNGVENPISWNQNPSSCIVRGGSYWNLSDNCRYSDRNWFETNNKAYYQGFRLLRSEVKTSQ